MELLLSLIKSNKAEVDQALTNDPCLKAEIEYDMRVFEKGKGGVGSRVGAGGASEGFGKGAAGGRRGAGDRRVSIAPEAIEHDNLKSGAKRSLRIQQPTLRKSTAGDAFDRLVSDRAVEFADEDDPDDDAPPKPKGKAVKRRRRKQATLSDDEDDEEDHARYAAHFSNVDEPNGPVSHGGYVSDENRSGHDAASHSALSSTAKKLRRR